MSKDIGNKCIYCFKDTSFGSGRFVNRIPASDDDHDGYACPECMEIECDRCGEMVGLDDDVRVNNLVLHWDCQTKAEYEIYCKENFIDIKEEPYFEDPADKDDRLYHEGVDIEAVDKAKVDQKVHNHPLGTGFAHKDKKGE